MIQAPEKALEQQSEKAPDINLEEILEIATSLTMQAGEKTLPFFEQYTRRTHTAVTKKDDNSPVTEADRQTELWLRKELERHFPDFGIIGEEFGANARANIDANSGTNIDTNIDTNSGIRKAHSKYTWIIDPIDGTRAFITGVPLYTTLLGLIDTETHQPLAGIIYAPVTKELVYAGIGTGAWFNHSPTKVRNIASFQEATEVSYDWQKVYKKSPQLLEVFDDAETVRSWGDGYGYILLATGRADIVIDPNMHQWDFLPIYPIIKEAGGYIESWEHNTVNMKSDNENIIACGTQTLLDYIKHTL